MSRSSTTSVREPRFELCSSLVGFVHAHVKPTRHNEAPRTKCFEQRRKRIASGIRFERLLCLCALSSFFFLMRVHAVDPSLRISQYGHTVWRVQDGTVASYTPITQTADGYIWMASTNKESLLRFDGSQFVPWLPPKGNPLPGKISFLLGTRDGSLWIGTRGGLSRLKDGQLSRYTKASDKFGISVMIEDHAGKIWLTRYRSPKGEGGLCEVGERGLRCYGPSDGVVARYGVGLAEDASGSLWFATENLDRWRPGTQAVEYFNSVKHPQLVDVAVDHSGDVWATMSEVGPKFGVRYFHNGIWSEYVAAGFHSSTLRAETLFVDSAGAVWIGTHGDGLYRLWKGVVDHFSKIDGLSGRYANSFYEDHEGNLWVSTDGGVDLFRNTPVITYSTDEGLSSGIISTVLASVDGRVWAGPQGNEDSGGVLGVPFKFADILRPGTAQRFSRGPRFPGRIGAMFQDHSGALWFGLDTQQMVVYEHGSVENVLSRDGHRLNEHIYAICEDQSHTILALTDAKLLLIRDRRILKAIELPTRLIGRGHLLPNAGGGIWIVGAHEGVMLYQSDVIQSQPLPTLMQPLINGVVADGADPLLLATSNGLFRWTGKRWDVLNETSGLPCNHLSGAIKDRTGSLWLPSNCGLLKMEALELQEWREHPESRPSFTSFDALDGARSSNGGYFTQPTASVGPDGKLWFATGVVIQMIDPDHVYRNLLPPPVHVDQLIADNKSFQPNALAQIPPNTRNLEIDYTAPSFSVPQKVQFRYFLEGHDKSWQGPVTRRQAFYTDLPPGKYRFHVVACNNDGVWNDVVAVAAFNVEPTFYQTFWFKALMAIAVLGVLWALYLLRLKQATANVHERLFAQIEERERIARELHDTLLQGFHGITLRMQGVTKNMPVRDPLRKMMEEVLDRGDEVLREARQRVRNLRRRTTDENELPDRLTKCGQELSKDHAATFTLAIVGEPKILESTVQDEAYRIAAEALTNAFRHASASKIEAEVTFDSSSLRIRVRDNGVGIDEAVRSNGHPGHWGLAGMRERAEAIRAQFNIWSRESAGTEVELVIQAAIAYPRDQRKPIESHPFRF